MSDLTNLNSLAGVDPEPLAFDNVKLKSEQNNNNIHGVMDTKGSRKSSSNSSFQSHLTNNNTDNLTLTTLEDLRLNSFIPLTSYSIIIALGGFIYGYDIGTIGGIVDMPAFVKKFADDGNGFTPVIKGLIVSISCLGGFASGVICSQIIPKVGMRCMISLALCVYATADLLILLSNNWKIVVISRVFNGMAVGCLTITCPMYISEITPFQYRGIFTCFTQLFITFGIVVGATTVYFTSINYHTGNMMQYQYPVFQGLIMSVCFSATMWFVPESPKWLVHKSKPVLKVKKSLGRINNIPYDDESIVNTTAKLFDLNFQEHNSNAMDEKTRSIRRGKPKYFLRTLTGITLYGFQQYTGINFFFYYGLMIFKSVDLKSPYLIPIIFGGINLIFSFLSIFLVSYFKRKTLLLFGSIMMTICMLFFTLVGTLLKDNRTIPLIILSCSFISLFSITWGPVATIVISELYPQNIKVKAMSICGSCSWIFNFSVTLLTPALTQVIGFNIGYGFTYFTCLSIFFIHFYVPETKDVHIKVIDSYYQHFKFYRKIGSL